MPPSSAVLRGVKLRARLGKDEEASPGGLPIGARWGRVVCALSQHSAIATLMLAYAGRRAQSVDRACMLWSLCYPVAPIEIGAPNTHSISGVSRCSSSPASEHSGARSESMSALGAHAAAGEACSEEGWVELTSVQHLPVCQILENQLITPKQSKVVCHTTYHTTSEL